MSKNEIVHYGVKGMHWGVRKGDHPEVSRTTNREARKDAQEFARAKQFYGEGAGTRRKLIKATVEGKKARSPEYTKAFDHHLAQQNPAHHAAKAQAERKRKNVKKSAGRGVRGTRHILMGNPQYASAATAIVVGGALAAHKAGIDKVILSGGKTVFNQAKESSAQRRARDMLRDMGIS